MQDCKRCKKRISSNKKSGFCRSCYIYNKSKAQRIKRKENNLCVSCGKKVKIDKCTHCKEIIKYYLRCDKCLKTCRIHIKNKRN